MSQLAPYLSLNNEKLIQELPVKIQKGKKTENAFIGLYPSYLLLKSPPAKKKFGMSTGGTTPRNEVPLTLLPFALFDTRQLLDNGFVISSSYDDEIPPFCFIFESNDKQEFLDSFQLHAGKFDQQTLPRGHVFSGEKVKKSLKACSFCSEKGKNYLVCSVCQAKVHLSCRVHCNFMDSCLNHYEKGPIDNCLPPTENGETKFKAALAPLSERIKADGYVELQTVKVFEILAFQALTQFPVELKPRVKVTPPSPIFDYDCFKEISVLDSEHISKITGKDLQSVASYLCTRTLDESLPLLKRIISASILSNLTNHQEKDRQFRAQLIRGNFIPGFVELLVKIMEAENVKKDQSVPNKPTDYNLESILLASKVANVVQYSLIDDHPGKTTLRDSVLKPLINAGLIAVDIIYHEKSKGNQSNQCARSLLSALICCSAPPVHHAYKDSETWQSYIAEQRGLALVLGAAELSYYTIHEELKAEDVKRSDGPPIYTGSGVKVMDAVLRGKNVILKEFSFGDDINKPPDWFMKEVTIQSLVGRHPNACSLLGAYHGPNADDGKFRAALLLEKYSRASLAKVMEQREWFIEENKRLGYRKRPKDWVQFFPLEFDTQFTINCILQACQGVAFLHSKGIMHRDIKPQNILCGDYYNTVICDFGISRVVPADVIARTTRIGTTPWMAPELLLPGRSIQTVKYQSDVYSMGIVLWQLVSGKINPYFQIDCFSQVPPPVNYREVIPDDAHPELQKLIAQMWAPLPQDRPTMYEVLDRLWGIKDKNGNRYAGRYELMTNKLWEKVGGYLDKRTCASLAIASKSLGAVFTSLLADNKKKYDAQVKADKKAFAKPTKIEIGNTRTKIANGVYNWTLYIRAQDGTTKLLDKTLNSATFTFPSSFYFPAVTLTGEPFVLSRTSHQLPTEVSIQLSFGKNQTASLVHHINFASDDFSTSYGISELIGKTTTNKAASSASLKVNALPKALISTDSSSKKKK